MQINKAEEFCDFILTTFHQIHIKVYINIYAIYSTESNC